MGNADVYKQHKLQEEDMLTQDRLKKGYQMPITQYELQSLVFNASENKLIRLDKAQTRSQAMIAMVLYRKGEFNMTLDRDRKTPKDEMPRIAPIGWKKLRSSRVKFFSALARGVPYSILSKKVPFFRRKEDLFSWLSDYNVPHNRALWCVKMTAILGFPAYDRKEKKQKKTLLETAPLELSQACMKTISATLNSLIRVNIEDEEQVEEIDYQWEYHTEFMKVMFHNGVLDKHEFLNDLCEIFTIFFLKRRENNPDILMTFMEYFYYFLEEISSSLVLTRRACSVLCQELRFLSDHGNGMRALLHNTDENGRLLLEKLYNKRGKRAKIPSTRRMWRFRDIRNLPVPPVVEPTPEEIAAEELELFALPTEDPEKQDYEEAEVVESESWDSDDDPEEWAQYAPTPEPEPEPVVENAEGTVPAAEGEATATTTAEPGTETGDATAPAEGDAEKTDENPQNSFPFNIRIKEEPMDYEEYTQQQGGEEEYDLVTPEMPAPIPLKIIRIKQEPVDDYEMDVSDIPMPPAAAQQDDDDDEDQDDDDPDSSSDMDIVDEEPEQQPEVYNQPSLMPEPRLDDPYQQWEEEEEYWSEEYYSDVSSPEPEREEPTWDRPQTPVTSDTYQILKLKDERREPEVLHQRYGNMGLPLWQPLMGSAVDTEYEDVLDFSNPTPPPAPTPVQIEFESSPSASPAPESEKGGEEGEKDKADGEKEKDKEEKTAEEAEKDKEKDKEKEAADAAAAAKKNAEDHGADLNVPTDDDVEMTDISDKPADEAQKEGTETADKEKPAEGEVAVPATTTIQGVVPPETPISMESSELLEKPSSVLAAVFDPLQVDMPMFDNVMFGPILEPIAPTDGIDTPPADKPEEEKDAPAVADGTDSAAEALKPVEPMEVDQAEAPKEPEAEAVEDMDTDDVIIIKETVAKKKPDEDDCVVIAEIIAEVPAKDKSADASSKPASLEKESEAEKEPETAEKKAEEGAEETSAKTTEEDKTEKTSDKNKPGLPDNVAADTIEGNPIMIPLAPPKEKTPVREPTEEELAEMARKAEEERVENRRLQKLKANQWWKKGQTHSSFRIYLECDNWDGVFYLMSGMVQYMTCVSPEALIWNDLSIRHEKHRPMIVPQLCGSPLDYLPCEVTQLPTPKGLEDIHDCLRLRQLEIQRRSKAVEEKWLPNGADVLKYGRIIDTCVDVIGIMDNIDVERPQSLENAAARLFKFREKFASEEAQLRTKLMFKWCITEEREGSFRAKFIARLLRLGMDMNEDKKIGGWEVLDLFFNFMHTEGPKYGSLKYQEHFDGTAAIMIEMLREKIFNIADIIAELEKEQEIDYWNPLMARQRKQKFPKGPKVKTEPMDDRKLVHFSEETTPKRLFMGKKMDLLERMIIILPQVDVEEDSDQSRIRRMLLFGLQPEGNVYFKRARYIYKSISKELESKLYIEFNMEDLRIIAHKKINHKGLDDLFRQFRAQTYHDQKLIIERIAYSFVDGMVEFLDREEETIPSPDIVNIICEMYEQSQDITSIFDFFEMVAPFLKAVDHKVEALRVDVLPGMYSTEMAFVFVSFFMKHWQRFLLHPRACPIVNQCYELVANMIRPEGSFITGWGRTVAIFVFHARKFIARADLQTEEFLGHDSHFWRVFPNQQHFDLDCHHYNEEIAGTKMQMKGGNLRYDSYTDFKSLLKSFKPYTTGIHKIKHPNARYSFVIRSFMEARSHERNFDRINELANYCANYTANDPALSEYWIGAIKGLCFLSVESPNPDKPYPFREMARQIDITDCSTHYALTTFITLLAGKSCFYIPRLLSELTKYVFPLMLRQDGRLSSSRTRDIKRRIGPKQTETRTMSEAEPGVCLCLMIISGLCCIGDEPFELSVHYRGLTKKKKRFKMTADERIMHLFHWFEMDQAMFKTLGHIAQLLEALRSRHRDAKHVFPKTFWGKDPEKEIIAIRERESEGIKSKHLPAYYRPQFLFNIAKTVQFVICEQDWVTLRMFRIFKTRKMELFNQDKLKQNCLGQQILRMALRRRTERDNVDKLFEAHAISKKATVDKVLSFMNLWNFRATLFDLMLMIKEISPDGNTRHAQQGAIAADALMCEIGKCCRDMFTFAYKKKTQMPIVKTLTEFRFSDINKYWLIAPLVRMCPKPINIPPQYANTTVGTVAAKFLREAAGLMETHISAPKERLAQSAWAMSRLPFINMILTCLRCEREQKSKDIFLSALLGQLQQEVHRERRKNLSHLWTNRRQHRDCTVLRLTLIGYIYREILTPVHVEHWGLLLFQLMFHGVLNPVREKMVYDTCFDMLQHMMLWTLVRTEHFNIYDRYGSYRLRWPSYAGLMKKIRKETNDKHTARSRHNLYRFLPIPKAQTTTITVRKYMNKPKNVGRLWKKHPCSIGIKNGKYAFLPEEKAKTHAFDHTPEFNCEQMYRGGGWKFHWFHTTRMDKVAKITPNVVRPILPHQHTLDFPRPQMVLSDNILDDIYMTPPDIEITGTIDTPEDEEDADKEKTGEEKTDKEKAEAKKKEGAEEKTDEEKKKDGEKTGTEEEKDKEKEKEKDKDKEEEKEGEKDKEKSKEASKKDDAETAAKDTTDDKDKDKEKDKSATEEATPKPTTPETTKDTDTPPATDKPAPVARSSPATRGRGNGRKRNSGARGGPRNKRANSRADASQAVGWNAASGSGASGSGSNYHAAMRATQTPMSNGSSDETKAKIHNMLNRKQEKRNSTIAANAAAATAAGVGAPGMPPAVPPATGSSIVPLGGAMPPNPSAMPPQMRPPNTMMPPSTMPGMPTGMSSGMPPMPGMAPPQTTALPTDTSTAGTAPPPPYSSTNQPQYPSHVFTAPNPGPLRTTVTSAITPEARKQIMEQQMHEKLAQQQQLFEQQRIQREQRDREAREHQERQKREQRMREEQARRQQEMEAAKMRAQIEENQRRQQEEFARIEQARKAEELRKAQEAARLAEQARIEQARIAAEQAQAEMMRLERERLETLRREEEHRARVERERLEKLRVEAEEKLRQEEEARRLEEMRIQREIIEERNRQQRAMEERLREQERERKAAEAMRLEEQKKREEAARIQQEQEAQAREMAAKAQREAAMQQEQRQRMMEQQRLQQQQKNSQFMGQQAPPAYGQQPQGQPPSYQQSSYQNMAGYQQGQQPPSYQQPSHGQQQQAGQQPPAYQAQNQSMHMQQQQANQARQHAQQQAQQSFGASSGMSQQRQQEFAAYGQPVGGQNQQGQSAQQQRNMFAGQPDMQSQSGNPPPKMLVHAKPNEAHAQQYQHTQAQLARAQREREEQYFQAKQLPASQANVPQTQRFGDTSAGNASGFARPNVPFGQQQAASSAHNQMHANQPTNRMLPAQSSSMQGQHQNMQGYQQPVLGQPGPMQTGGQQPGAQQQAASQPGAQHQYGGARPAMHTTPQKADGAMGGMGQMANRMAPGAGQQGYGHQGQDPSAYQSQQGQHQGQVPGYQRAGMDQRQQQQSGQFGGPSGHQNQQMGQAQQHQGAGQNPGQYARQTQDATGYQSGYNRDPAAQQSAQPAHQPAHQAAHQPSGYSRPDQQQAHQQHGQYGGAQNPMAQQQQQSQHQQAQHHQQQQQQMHQQQAHQQGHGQYARQGQGQDQYQQAQQQQAQQQKNPMAQGAQYGRQDPAAGYGGQAAQSGYGQQGQAAQASAHQNQQMHQHSNQQQQQYGQQQQQQQQPNRYGAMGGGQYGGSSGNTSNILAQSMEESGLSLPGSHALSAKQNVPGSQGGQAAGNNMMQQQGGYDRHGMQSNAMHMQQAQQQQQAQRMAQAQAQAQAQQGMHQQQGQPGMGRPGMGMGQTGQQPQQQAAQAQQQQQRQMNPMGGAQLPPYSMGQQQQQQGQQDQQTQQYRQQMQMQQQQQAQQAASQQNRMGMQAGAQHQSGYGGQMQLPPLQHRGQGPQAQGMGTMGGHTGMQQQQQPGANQYYQQQQADQRLQQQQQQQQQQQGQQQPQQHGYGMGQYPNQQQQHPY